MFTSTYYYAYCAHPQFSILKIKTDDCWSSERSDSHKTVERGSDHHHLERGWHFYGNTKVGAAGKNNRPVILKFLRYDCFGVYERIDFQ